MLQANYTGERVFSYPKVLLHFDINGTLILKDTSKEAMLDEKDKSTSTERMLISALAESTFQEWDKLHGKISYKQYVYDVLLPGDKSDPILKKARQKVVANFFNWMKENEHPALEKVQADYRAIKAKYTDALTKETRFTVFPSFFVMLAKLREKNIPFTIILRTFGGDLAEVTEEIEQHVSGVKFTYRGKFEDTQLKLSNETIEKVGDVFDKILKADGHFAIKDDHEKWNKDKELGRSGKPFIYDSSGNRHGVKNLSFFFDDNITGQEKDIVRRLELNGHCQPYGELEDYMLYPVSTKDAMLDDNYYYNRVMSGILKAKL